MSYVIISYPKFKAFTSAGVPAVGYKVYSYAPGTTTNQTTYSERTLTSDNTNPIILDANGECIIYTGQAVKLVLKTSADALVWTFDYLAEQQDTFVIASTVTSTHNQYTVTSSPAVGALSSNLTLMMTPDTTNTSTLTLNTFNGTGVDDCTEGGAYSGTTTGSSYYITIDGAFEAAPTAPTAVETNDVGLVTVGNHYVKVSFVTAIGETTLSPASSVVAADGAETIAVTNIDTGSAQVTGRNIYMTGAGGTDYYLVHTISDNTTTTYTISIADATLTANPLAPTTDSTGIADTFSWRKDTGTETPGVAITADGTTQAIAEGITVQFAVKAGHTLADYWKIDVETPARVNLDGLGSLIVYKNKGGAIVALDGSDMYAGYPAQLVLNAALNAWLLINPATPTFSTTEISAVRYRKNLTADYALLLADQGYELNFTSAATLTLLAAGAFGNRFFYVKNSSTGIITVDAGADYLIYGNSLTGSRYFYVGPGGNYQLQTNGIDWHVMTSLGFPALVAQNAVTAAASSSFTGLIPGIRYRMEWEVTPTVAATYFHITFNDAIATYSAALNYTNSSGVLAGDGIALTYVPVVSTEVSDLNTGLAWGHLEFTTIVGNDKYVKLNGISNYSDGAVMVNGSIYGTFVGAADLTKITFLTDDVFTGNLLLYQVG